MDFTIPDSDIVKFDKLIHIVKTGIAKGNSCTSIFIDESLL